VKLGFGFPCSENRSKERDKRLYRLAHDAARAARSAFRPGRLLLLTFLGEARKVSAAAHSRQCRLIECCRQRKTAKLGGLIILVKVELTKLRRYAAILQAKLAFHLGHSKHRN
jgi:hypothetical protein